MNVRVLGRGKVGRALHAALGAASVKTTLHRGTSLPPRNAQGAVFYILAVPDAQIRTVSERIAVRLRAGDVVVHCSGNRGPQELEACRAHGAKVATLHPMLSFASARAVPDLRDSMWIARGDKLALRAAKKLARALGARCVEGPAGQPAYHAAAALSANGSVALAQLATSVLQALGLDRKVAQVAIAGLLRSVASNVAQLGVPDALTGPIVRGDADTVRSHVRALHALDATFAASYVTLAPLILACAQAGGLSPHEAEHIQTALREAHTKPQPLTSKGKPSRPRRR